jgi:hypothetical protein
MLDAYTLRSNNRGARADKGGAGQEGRTSFELARGYLQVDGEMRMATVKKGERGRACTEEGPMDNKIVDARRGLMSVTGGFSRRQDPKCRKNPFSNRKGALNCLVKVPAKDKGFTRLRKKAKGSFNLGGAKSNVRHMSI